MVGLVASSLSPLDKASSRTSSHVDEKHCDFLERPNFLEWSAGGRTSILKNNFVASFVGCAGNLPVSHGRIC